MATKFVYVWADEFIDIEEDGGVETEMRAMGHCLKGETYPTLSAAMRQLERIRLEMGLAHLGEGKIALYRIEPEGLLPAACVGVWPVETVGVFCGVAA